MPGRETTIPTIPSDTATFDEEPGAAKAVLRRDSKPTCLTFDGTREVLRAMRPLPMISSKRVHRSGFREASSLASGDGSESMAIRHSAQPVRQPAPPGRA